MDTPESKRKADVEISPSLEFKRRKTNSVIFDFERANSFDSNCLENEPYDQVTPPENMDWLCNAIEQNGGKPLFSLSEKFLEPYRSIQPPFGFNGLGELVYMRTYSRIKADGTNETWVDTIQRVVEGVFEVLKAHTLHVTKTEWDEVKATESAQEMFDRMFKMKFLPPGRGLWAMGTAIVREKGLGAALNNCAFVSTDDIAKDPVAPFTFLMDAAMLGVGVGFDTEGAGKINVQPPKEPAVAYVVADTREGWVDSLRVLLDGYFKGANKIQFDYSQVRPAGLPLKTFGGMSSGPDPLRLMHDTIESILQKHVGQPLNVTTIVDLMNLIGKCVVAGNVRRTAEIAFGKAGSSEFLDLKNYEVNPERAEYGWTSNNSIFASLGMDYTEAAERIQKNGEPGFAWLNNMQAYSRMKSKPNWRDEKVKGGNPCLEQSLESMELCCLVETFPFHHADIEDYQATVKCALLYAKTVTLITVHWPATRAVMNRNRRIGCSVSGIAQCITAWGLHTLRNWLETGYQTIKLFDQRISRWLQVPQSVKLTSVKPSGTISLVAGATPGIHYPESRYYIRRVRMAKDFRMLPVLRESGYKVEPAFGSEASTVVVEVPVDVGDGIRGVAEVSMWEQLCLAAFMQKYWADNQVSATITFDPAKEGNQIAHALQYFQYQLKGVSFLPRHDYGAFPQMPYEAIDANRYVEEMAHITPLNTVNGSLRGSDMPPRTKSEIVRVTDAQEFTTHKMEDAFCDGEKCTMNPAIAAEWAAKKKAREEVEQPAMQ